MFFCLLQFINITLLQWLPESARYDVTRGNIEKAQATIERIAKENGKPMLLGKLQETNLQVSILFLCFQFITNMNFSWG